MRKPLIVGIGGAHSGAGKTTYAALLIKKLKGWGAVKYTKTALYSSIIDDVEILAKEDKDTGIFLSSGAERVLWVQAPASELGDILPQAIERLSDLKGIIVEGNSAIEFLKPDVIIFIWGNDPNRIKESARRMLNTADVLVGKISPEDQLKWKLRLDVRVFHKTPDDHEKFTAYVLNMVEKKEQIRFALSEKAVAGKIACPLARKLAEELNISFKEIGKTADELEIKITDCELGCF